MSNHFGGYMDFIGKRLREERARLGMTQEKMALAGGVQKRAQARYEAGERCPDGRYLALISGLGADVNYILTGVQIPIVQSSTAKTKGIEILEDVKKSPTKVVARNLGELGVSEDDLSLARMINRLPEAQKNTKIADIETLLRSNYEAIQDWLAREGNMQKVA
jgi:transcriptional regulator with XRE-family HTH domain